MGPVVRSGRTAQEVAEWAAERIADLLHRAIEQRGVATLALSGGSSPAMMFAHLAQADLDWSAVHVLQVDERVVDFFDPDRNWSGILGTLVSPTGAHGHPLTIGPGLDDRAAALIRRSDVARLRATAGDPPTLDIVHLGLGADGHTASWPPGDPVLDAVEPIAVVRDFNGYDRLTLTPPVVNAARNLVWLVLGEAKREMLERLLAGDPSIPAGSVSSDHAELFTDLGWPAP